jgi:hypothetical protein
MVSRLEMLQYKNTNQRDGQPAVAHPYFEPLGALQTTSYATRSLHRHTIHYWLNLRKVMARGGESCFRFCCRSVALLFYVAFFPFSTVRWNDASPFERRLLGKKGA